MTDRRPSWWAANGAWLAAKIVGLAALLVHAMAESANHFGISRNFVESVVKPMMMCIMLETAHKASAE